MDQMTAVKTYCHDKNGTLVCRAVTGPTNERKLAETFTDCLLTECYRLSVTDCFATVFPMDVFTLLCHISAR